MALSVLVDERRLSCRPDLWRVLLLKSREHIYYITVMKAGSPVCSGTDHFHLIDPHSGLQADKQFYLERLFSAQFCKILNENRVCRT